MIRVRKKNLMSILVVEHRSPAASVQKGKGGKIWNDTTRAFLVPIATTLFTVFGTLYFLKPQDAAIQLETIAEQNHLTAQTQFRAMVSQNEMEAKRAVVDSFIQSSYLYGAVTYDILARTGKEKEGRWNDLYDDFARDCLRMRLYFGEVVDLETVASEELAETFLGYKREGDKLAKAANEAEEMDRQEALTETGRMLDMSRRQPWASSLDAFNGKNTEIAEAAIISLGLSSGKKSLLLQLRTPATPPLRPLKPMLPMTP